MAHPNLRRLVKLILLVFSITVLLDAIVPPLFVDPDYAGKAMASCMNPPTLLGFFMAAGILVLGAVLCAVIFLFLFWLFMARPTDEQLVQWIRRLREERAVRRHKATVIWPS